MSCWENSACLPVPKEENSERPKDLKAVLITGRPIYFAGLNESGSLGDIAKMVRKPRNPVLE
jgi:hypothetical protein